MHSEVGHGTRVTVELRLPALSALGLVETSLTPDDEQLGPALHVLLVDDHPANRLLLGQQLNFLGHSVVELEDGQQAFAASQKESFDVVITDCNMPVMDGYELTRRIRADEQEAKRVPCLIIGFTANAQMEERQRCLAVGMDDCLFKPVSLGMLRGCLSRMSDRPIAAGQEQIAQPPTPVFDLELLDSLTGGDPKLIHMLFSALHDSNKLDLCKLDEMLAAGRWRYMGQLVHRLKGAARMVGAQGLCDAAVAYEEGLAQSAVDDEVLRLARNVRAAVQQLQEALTKQGLNKTS
ncbi:response regulator [Pseudomonas peli]|uniref:response regulator n=1 Tax=Pseudomonas peli TaxID=592361 RepID=UPI0024AD1A6C|nr:response regulator [Pseudomonas peli]